VFIIAESYQKLLSVALLVAFGRFRQISEAFDSLTPQICSLFCSRIAKFLWLLEAHSTKVCLTHLCHKIFLVKLFCTPLPAVPVDTAPFSPRSYAPFQIPTPLNLLQYFTECGVCLNNVVTTTTCLSVF